MGFLEYRILIEDDSVVLYIWEIHLVPRVHKQGLGRYMMQIAELIARKHGLDKIMLTVFKQNVTAMNFYKNKLRYVIDDTDPSMSGEKVNYEILSKVLVCNA
jgi:ribosomal protein S18 acetylase RimI-like enzyme